VGARLNSAGREAWRYIADMWFGDAVHGRFLAACEAIDLSPPQLKALLSLEPGQTFAMRALAEGWKCDASWVTGIVDGLEQHGYAERQVHPTDRRVKVVAITPEGEKAKERALEFLHEPPEGIDALTAPEQRQLRDLLAKVSEANSRPGRATA
jgi:DNA-binding MarR family transcriptional regulator